ncbi:MAG: bifunctional 2-C-methyl-D-erythritol 4-phosphate cytidylyltransferase/2-C-methyl-D-erythritol 2,4-cyclodiphosphate synthase [Alphaproteobacteria bacterium]|nr:bifunctional 2-C-methyl-D-erythritol 4-phosphate cytidylyltransferase/2-C-methyl-D-erythritol 2,4-cyclodiphosphate synthase [Alphaproteobacteria bacterium]
MAKIAALIVAAGRGNRFGTELPKQYQMLAGKMVLRHSLETFANHPEVNIVKAVIHPDVHDIYNEAAEGLNILPPTNGGAARQDSVRLGLESIESEKPDIVLIHDGARPFVDHEIIDDAMAAISDQIDGAIPAVQIVDTLKKATAPSDTTTPIIQKTVDRENLWGVQTPQAFKYNKLLEAHQKTAGEQLTDDAAVIEKFGGKVALSNGKEENFKITSFADLEKAENYIINSNKAGKKSMIKIGNGFDVHKFAEGNFVTLCGIDVPHTHKLEGHSDADVSLHALTDALLGTIGAGDIGTHFPPSDNKWKGAKSDIFAKHAVKLIEKEGGAISNIDLTIICERPKIGEHRQKMVTELSKITNVPEKHINIKATTTEGLGFTGRKEGIASLCSVLVEFS